MGERDLIVCCPVPVSNSQNDPILSPEAARSCHRRPTARVAAGGRCGRRESTAVNSQMGSTDDLQPVSSKMPLPLNLHARHWPVAAAAAVMMEPF